MFQKSMNIKCTHPWNRAFLFKDELVQSCHFHEISVHCTEQITQAFQWLFPSKVVVCVAMLRNFNFNRVIRKDSEYGTECLCPLFHCDYYIWHLPMERKKLRTYLAMNNSTTKRLKLSDSFSSHPFSSSKPLLFWGKKCLQE